MQTALFAPLALSLLAPSSLGQLAHIQGRTPSAGGERGIETKALFGRLHSPLPPSILQFSSNPGVAAGDLDEDGRPDLVMTERFGSVTVTFAVYDTLLLNRGLGVFERQAAAFPEPSRGTRVRLRDFSGDGKTDVLFGPDGLNEPSELKWHVSLGGGHFLDRTCDLPVGPYLGADTADLNGDGSEDIFFVGTSGPGLLLNDGNGGFALSAVSVFPPSAHFIFADAELDGDIDLFVRDSLNGAEETLLLANDGSGDFVNAGAMPTLLGEGRFLGEDVDGDGDPDLVSFDGVHYNDGSGSFPTSIVLDSPPSFNPFATSRPIFSDVDGDGNGDLVSANRLYISDGSGGFIESSSRLPARLAEHRFGDAATIDYDGDGDEDLVVGSGRSSFAPAAVLQERIVLINDGSGEFFDSSELTSEGDFVPGEIGDLDLDGFPDGVSSYSYKRGDGTGRYGDSISLGLPEGLTVNATELCDLDGERGSEVVVGLSGIAPPFSSGVHILRAQAPYPSVSFELERTDLSGVFSSLAVGDLDGDGDADVVAASENEPSQDNLFLENNGSGQLSRTQSFKLSPLPSKRLRQVQLVDLDGDLDLDLVVNESDFTLATFRNDGRGGFERFAASGVPVLGGGEILADDVDADGDVDWLFRGAFELRLFLRGPRNRFIEDSTRVAGMPVDGIQLVDIDLDGDLDLAGLLVFLNDGSAHFSQLVVNPPLSIPSARYRDLDGDGDYDLASPEIRQNLTRHLSWRNLPRIGEPLILDLSGPPGSAWILEHARGLLPIRGTGVPALDPATKVVVASGVLDLQGRASIHLAVPPNPSLVGTTSYFLAEFAPTRTVTNVEKAVWSDI